MNVFGGRRERRRVGVGTADVMVDTGEKAPQASGMDVIPPTFQVEELCDRAADEYYPRSS